MVTMNGIRVARRFLLCSSREQHLASVGSSRTLVHATTVACPHTVRVSLCACYCGYYIAINGTSQCNFQSLALPPSPLLLAPLPWLHSPSSFPRDFQASLPIAFYRERKTEIVLLSWIIKISTIYRAAMPHLAESTLGLTLLGLG